MTVNYDNDGSSPLLVAQPGGAFMKLKCSNSKDEEELADSNVNDGEEDTDNACLNIYQDLAKPFTPDNDGIR